MYFFHSTLIVFNLFLDWLDNGNNKKALQEAEKVLKKQPNFHCAKVRLVTIKKSLEILRLEFILFILILTHNSQQLQI